MAVGREFCWPGEMWPGPHQTFKFATRAQILASSFDAPGMRARGSDSKVAVRKNDFLCSLARLNHECMPATQVFTHAQDRIASSF